MTESEQKMLYEHSQKMPFIPADDKDLQLILLSAFRYALGRRTYIVSTFCDFVKPLIPWLSDNTLFLMEREITQEAVMKVLGGSCDEENWLELRKAILHELKGRNHKI